MGPLPPGRERHDPPERGPSVVLNHSGGSPARCLPGPVEAGIWAARETPGSLGAWCWATRTVTLVPSGNTNMVRAAGRVRSFPRAELDPELAELGLVHLAGGVHQQVHHRLRLRERDDVPDVVGAGQEHHDPVQPGRDAAVRRDAVLERLQQVAEALPDGLLAQAQDLEDPLLQRAVVDPEAAA